MIGRNVVNNTLIETKTKHRVEEKIRVSSPVKDAAAQLSMWPLSLYLWWMLKSWAVHQRKMRSAGNNRHNK